MNRPPPAEAACSFLAKKRNRIGSGTKMTGGVPVPSQTGMAAIGIYERVKRRAENPGQGQSLGPCWSSQFRPVQ